MGVQNPQSLRAYSFKSFDLGVQPDGPSPRAGLKNRTRTRWKPGPGDIVPNCPLVVEVAVDSRTHATPGLWNIPE